MKKLPALFFYAMACAIIASSCIHGNDGGNVDISFQESDQFFSMNAHFGNSSNRDVERYVDSKIGKRSNMSFVNSEINGKVSLDDHTTFYVKKSPGVLKIKLDKNENSEEAYHRVKSMCEGIKKVLAK